MILLAALAWTCLQDRVVSQGGGALVTGPSVTDALLCLKVKRAASTHGPHAHEPYDQTAVTRHLYGQLGRWQGGFANARVGNAGLDCLVLTAHKSSHFVRLLLHHMHVLSVATNYMYMRGPAR